VTQIYFVAKDGAQGIENQENPESLTSEPDEGNEFKGACVYMCIHLMWTHVSMCALVYLTAEL